MLKKIEFLSEPFGKLNLLERVVRISALHYQNPVSNMSSECFSIFKTETLFINNGGDRDAYLYHIHEHGAASLILALLSTRSLPGQSF